MKLLNRTLFGFLIYAVAVLLIVTPILYMVINNVIIHNVDETLQVHKREIQSRLEHLPSETDVRQWEDLDGEVIVEPLNAPFARDSIYTVDEDNHQKNRAGHRRNEDHRDGRGSRGPQVESYRVLTSSVMIKGKPYKLQARISLVESDDLIRTLGLTQLVVLIMLLTGMLVINWWNSRTLWSPFYKTVDTLKSFQIEKNTPITVEHSTIKEFNDLNVAIEALTKRDRQVFTSQREFTENAAHEMQTPLAIFQSKVELLMQTKPSDQQAALIESLLDATSRLNRLNKALLLLARIDNHQFPETETIDVAKATNNILTHYIEEAMSKQMDFKVEVMQPLQVTFNGSLLDILLSNLVVNAMRHGDAGTQVEILIDQEQWVIKNQARPMSINVGEIFERFRKGTSNQSSLGLGLAIAKKISDSEGLTLLYMYELQNHVFSVRFPKSKLSPKSIS
jgi:signal transduction histidine kinase